MPRFADMVDAHGLTFIGPSADHIGMMGDKIAAKTAMAAVGIPWFPAPTGELPDMETARAVAERIGYPVLIKAAAGGGGRGMKVAREPSELEDAFRLARVEARAAFGNDAVYMEKYLDRPRHIELQIMADNHGNVVHFGERDCSLQRRHQKLLEEAGSPAIRWRSVKRWARPRQRRCAGLAIATPARLSSCTRTDSSPSSR